MVSTRTAPTNPVVRGAANASGSRLETPVFALPASDNVRVPERELRAFGTTMMLENPFRRMFLSSKLRLDGSGSIATTVAAFVAALNVYSPMCAPASTTTSPIPTWNHPAVKGSYLPEIKSKSLVRGRTSKRTRSTETPKFERPGTQWPTDPKQDGTKI